MLHRRAAALRRNQPQVGLVSTFEQHARLGISLTEDALDMWMRNERLHEALFTTNSEDVDVAACLPSTPQAADRDQLDVAVVHAQEIDE